MTPEQFEDLCTECWPQWMVPRNEGWRMQRRKHGIKACMFAVIGSLCTANTALTMEAVCRMSHGVIGIEFERMLMILDDVMVDDMCLMDEDERKECYGCCKSDQNMIYFIDGNDFPLEEEKERWMYHTHKDNVKKKTAIRAQILIDTCWGFFRGLECANAGTNNDQGMLLQSVWNQPNALTTGSETVGADSGYWPTKFVNVTKPFSESELIGHPDFVEWNAVFNSERALSERSFGFLQKKFQIFAQPWRRDKQLFPIALRVAMKLCNRYWREDDNCPLGLKKQIDTV